MNFRAVSKRYLIRSWGSKVKKGGTVIPAKFFKGSARRFGRVLVAAVLTAGMTTVSVVGLATASQAASTKGTISVGVLSEQLGSQTDVDNGVTIAADAMNASGGLDGMKIKLDICNFNYGEVNTALGCVRADIKKHVVAFVGNVSVQDTAIDPVLQTHGIACIGCAQYVPAALRSPIQFGIVGGLFATSLAVVAAEEDLNAKVVALPVPDDGSGPAVIGLTNTILAAHGLAALNPAACPAIDSTDLDVSAPVAAFGATNPGALVDGLAPTVLSRVIQEMRQQGQNEPVIVSGAILGPAQIPVQLAGADSNIYVANEFNHNSAGYAQFLKERAKYVSSANINDQVAEDWTSLRLAFAGVVKLIPKGHAVTAASVFAAAHLFKGDLDGMTPELSFAKNVTLAGGSSTRNFNPSIVLYKWNSDGSETPIDGGKFITYGLKA
jgi:ABC-type branched-subunit amino acid transport system substrate-binding protein